MLDLAEFRYAFSLRWMAMIQPPSRVITRFNMSNTFLLLLGAQAGLTGNSRLTVFAGPRYRFDYCRSLEHLKWPLAFDYRAVDGGPHYLGYQVSRSHRQ